MRKAIALVVALVLVGTTLYYLGRSDAPESDPAPATLGISAASLSESDPQQLIEQIWASASSDEVAFESLRQILLHDYDGADVSFERELVLFSSAKAIGATAAESPEAFAFATRATSPDYWRETRSWTSTLGRESDDMLASYSIQAVGLSGTSDALTWLVEARNREPWYLHRFGGDIAQAAFLFDERRRRGVDFMSWHSSVTAEEFMEAYDAWATTPSGLGWTQWAGAVTRGPVPKRTESNR